MLMDGKCFFGALVSNFLFEARKDLMGQHYVVCLGSSSLALLCRLLTNRTNGTQFFLFRLASVYKQVRVKLSEETYSKFTKTVCFKKEWRLHFA